MVLGDMTLQDPSQVVADFVKYSVDGGRRVSKFHFGFGKRNKLQKGAIEFFLFNAFAGVNLSI